MHRHMAVDDMSVVALYLEGIENTVAYGLVESQLEIITLLFLVGLGILEELALKGGHLRFVE